MTSPLLGEFRLFYCGTHFPFHGGRPGIQFVWTIQRDGGDLVRDFVDRFLGGHEYLRRLASGRRSLSPASAVSRCRGDRGLKREAPAQNVKRKPSWIWRLGKAEVKASGVLDVAVPPPERAEPGLIPFTLNVVNPEPGTPGMPGLKPKTGPTSLFTLA